jgi:hypothetical protein
MLLSRLLRKEWLALGVAWLIITLITNANPDRNRIGITFLIAAVYFAFWIIIQVRFGLLATVSYGVCVETFTYFPITPDFSAWYAQGTYFVFGVYLAICGYGFYTSLGGQKLIQGRLLED